MEVRDKEEVHFKRPKHNQRFSIQASDEFFSYIEEEVKPQTIPNFHYNKSVLSNSKISDRIACKN